MFSAKAHWTTTSGSSANKLYERRKEYASVWFELVWDHYKRLRCPLTFARNEQKFFFLIGPPQKCLKDQSEEEKKMFRSFLRESGHRLLCLWRTSNPVLRMLIFPGKINKWIFNTSKNEFDIQSKIIIPVWVEYILERYWLHFLVRQWPVEHIGLLWWWF